MERTWIVYAVKSNLTGKMYIGQTCRPLHWRMSQHRSLAKHGSVHYRMSLLAEAMREEGLYSFECVPLDTAYSQEEAWEKERAFIAKYRSLEPNGFNRSSGGAGSSGCKMPPRSPETLERLRVVNTGKTMSIDSRKKMRLAKLGKPLPPEHRSKMSDARLGRKFPQTSLTMLKNRNRPPLFPG